MIKSIFTWLKIIRLNHRDIFLLSFFIVIETICYSFGPVSFAYIASFTSEQNIHMAWLWACINFMLQILNYIIFVIKQQRLISINVSTFTSLQESKMFKIEDSKYFSNFIFKFNNLITFSFKIVAILITSLIYSFYITVFIFCALIISLLLSIIIDAIRSKKQRPEIYGYQLLICDTILNCIWSGFSFIIILTALNLINNQDITLTIFLLITTFISNHISKSELTIKHLINIKELNRRIKNLNNKNFVE